jgi:putative membrane protein
VRRACVIGHACQLCTCRYSDKRSQLRALRALRVGNGRFRFSTNYNRTRCRQFGLQLSLSAVMCVPVARRWDRGRAKVKVAAFMIQVSDDRFFRWLVMGLLAGAVISGMHPYRFWPWVFEILPVLLILAVMVLSRGMFVFTRMAYLFMVAGLVMMMIGAHYTYAQVPWFNTLRDTFHLGRNHFDRVGHFMQGLVPAMVLREMFLRTTTLSRGVIIALVITLCAGVSAFWELLEWFAVLVMRPAGVQLFLGMQGDFWDAQYDMLCAVGGAVSYCLLLAGGHDRAIARMSAPPVPSPERIESLRYRYWSRFVIWFGLRYCAFEPPRIRAVHIRRLLEVLEPGSILCRDNASYTSRLFIPGKYSHSAVVIDDRTVIHAMEHGLQRMDVLDFVKDCDGFVVLRPPYREGCAERVVAEAQALLRQGIRYNFSFRERAAALYCHEFTNRCLAAVHLAVPARRHRTFWFFVRDLVHADLFLETFRVVLEVYHPPRASVPERSGAPANGV